MPFPATEKKAGALMLSKVSAKNDTYTRIHEDPLLVMKRKENTVS